MFWERMCTQFLPKAPSIALRNASGRLFRGNFRVWILSFQAVWSYYLSNGRIPEGFLFTFIVYIIQANGLHLRVGESDKLFGQMQKRIPDDASPLSLPSVKFPLFQFADMGNKALFRPFYINIKVCMTRIRRESSPQTASAASGKPLNKKGQVPET